MNDYVGFASLYYHNKMDLDRPTLAITCPQRVGAEGCAWGK
jgi:hypothetical protein